MPGLDRLKAVTANSRRVLLSKIKLSSQSNTSKTKSTSKSKPKPKPERVGPRRLKGPKYKSFRVTKAIKPSQPKLPSAYRLFKTSLSVVKQNKKLIIGLTVIYAILTMVLVNGFGNSLNTVELKDTMSDLVEGNLASLTVTAGLFGALVTSAGSTASESGGIYQSILLVVFCLATIYGLRRIFAGDKVTVKDSFYKGMYPLIPFLLVLLVIGLQLVPMALGGWVYGLVVSNNIAITGIEKSIWLLLFGLTAILSIYMVSSSIFSLIIVTLPNMTPLKALRSARQLVLHRRLLVVRKLLFLPISLLIVAALIMLPVLLWLTIIADWLFFMLTLLGTIFTLIYIYVLYRELLSE